MDKNILETNFGLLPVTPFEETNKFSAIIVAVGHDYRSIPIQKFRKTLVTSGVIMDLKWIFLKRILIGSFNSICRIFIDGDE